jgi:uncharacterized RDD family membrane protein YckC
MKANPGEIVKGALAFAVVFVSAAILATVLYAPVVFIVALIVALITVKTLSGKDRILIVVLILIFSVSLLYTLLAMNNPALRRLAETPGIKHPALIIKEKGRK